MHPLAIKIIFGYLLAMNLITFFLYGWDKYKAKHDYFRIPEKILLLFAYLGGAYGAAVGMQIWHHKTRKWKFRIAIPISVVLLTIVIGLFLHRVLVLSG